MGWRRMSGVPLGTRLRASFWTSVGVGCFLLGSIYRHELGVFVDEAEEPLARKLRSDTEEKELYPEDLVLTKPYEDDPNRWLVFLHVIGICYMLLGLNTVCDVYFAGALEVMVDKWNVKADVAGATFMAAGGSAPEFFTSLIGTTVAHNDVGFSTIVGSAVFNVLFVIGACGYVAADTMELTWWPLFRDCTYYICGLILLAIFASDSEISIEEAIALFIAYLLYLCIMYMNPQLEELVDTKMRKKKKQVAPDQDNEADGDKKTKDVETGDGNGKNPPTSYGKMEDVDDEVLPDKKKKQMEPEVMPEKPINNTAQNAPEATPEIMPETEDGKEEGSKEGADKESGEDEGSEDSGEIEFMNKPEGLKDQIMWYLCLPVYIPLYYLTPKPDDKWFFATFIISILWIGGYAFLLVWWVEILGQVCRVDEIIMGFTLLAAGTSIPDAVSSMAVARAGEGDMAVSSSIGSNIFDILVGLPIPWIIKTGIIEGGGFKVRIQSPYLTFYVLLLLLMVFLTVMSIHMLGWKLNKMLGLAMAGLYVMFLTIALIVEFNEPEALRF